MTDSYLGCKAQIATKSKFKYEGIISAINPLDMTICLSAVHIIDGPGKVDPAREYASVTFKSGDVLDLQVFEKEPLKEPVVENKEEELVDPAILEYKEAKDEGDWLDPQFYNGPPKLGPYSNLPTSYKEKINRSAQKAKSAPSPEDYSAEYDFSANNARFEKQAAATEANFYDRKVSFFDKLTTDVEAVRERDGVRNSKNMETFGTTGSEFRGRGRGGRGRGRGGRGSSRRSSATSSSHS